MSHVLDPSASFLHRSVRTEEFLISFTEPFRAVFLGTLLTLEAMCLAAGAAGEWWLLTGVVPGLTLLLSALSVGVIIWRYRFTVGPEGIACYDFWCRPLTTRWSEMQQASLIWLPGLRYIRIPANDRYRALWLPLFVADPEGLLNLVEIHAGSTHPVTQLLREQFAE